MTVFDLTTDNFSTHDGALHNYVGPDRVTPVSTQEHYDIRSFMNESPTVPWTMNDLQLWNAFNFTGTTMTNMQNRSVVGRVNRSRTVGEIDTLTMTQLDTNNMNFLDFVVVSSGNEEWPASDVNVTFGRDSGYRYSNSINITLTGGVSKTVTSFYFDDILTDFQDQPYFIEMVLRNFPAQAAGSYLNLTGSFIDFSSDPSFDPTVTDSIPFSASVNNLSAGGDLTFRIPRTLLVNSDPSNLRGIQFRLLSTGAMTFTAQAMRLIPSLFVSRPVEINTKMNALTRFVPRAGGAESSSVLGPILFSGTSPLNSTIWSRFYTGHNPTGTDNTLRVYARYQRSGDYIGAVLSLRDTQSRISLVQNLGGTQTTLVSTPVASNILTNNTNYFLKTEIKDNQIRASIYTSVGVSTGSLVYTTNWQTVTLMARGDLGYSFEPYNYDFTLDYFSTTQLEYAHFQSTPFNSRSTVIGSTLKAFNSAPVNLLMTNNLVSLGDATEIMAGNVTTVTRDGTNYFGGLTSPTPIVIGDSSELAITGSIYTPPVLNGNFQIVIVDINNSVGWIRTIPNLLPNQWNDFSIDLGAVIAPFSYYIYVIQNGFYADTFQVRDLAVNFDGVAWESTADGATWQPYLHALDAEFTGVHYFAIGTSLAVRATARSDDAWIEGYELIPRYGLLGQAGSQPFHHTSFSATVATAGILAGTASFGSDVRVTASGSHTVSASLSVNVSSGVASTTANVRVNTSIGASLPLVLVSSENAADYGTGNYGDGTYGT